ncbi:hypothetical protein KPB2_5350 [Klebsiella pneumoniae Kb677]|nr:hypothetical protein KPB2_5350 [Klebsiella pneumoniae Kb677]
MVPSDGSSRTATKRGRSYAALVPVAGMAEVGDVSLGRSEDTGGVVGLACSSRAVRPCERDLTLEVSDFVSPS